MGWWELSVEKTKKDRTTTDEITEEDKEHIAVMIKQGYTQGELNDEGE